MESTALGQVGWDLEVRFGRVSTIRWNYLETIVNQHSRAHKNKNNDIVLRLICNSEKRSLLNASYKPLTI